MSLFAVGNSIMVALGILEPEKGPPETFFLVSIVILGFISGCTYAIAYLWIGKKMPVLIFPILMLAVTQLTAGIIPSENMAVVLQLESGTEFGFYLIFYLCFILTGGLLPSFYFLTAYRSEKPKKHILFALIYGVLIWTPS